MKITTMFSNENTVFIINIEGDFNFSQLHEFKKSYSDIETLKDKKIIVDLRNTLTVDSSALGMLLNLQTELSKQDQEIEIINSNDVVRKIFHITNFEKKFSIK